MSAYLIEKIVKQYKAHRSAADFDSRLVDKDVDAITVLELEIKHKHGGFNINYEKATVAWQRFG